MADRPIVFELLAEGTGEFAGNIASLHPVIATFTAALTGAAAAVVEVGREMERQAGVWNHFRGDISQARQATGGLISDLQLMTAHNELMRRGIETSARDFRNVMVAALEQADASGRDFDTTFQQLLRGLRSGNTTIEELEEHFGNVAASADTAGGKIEQFEVALENAQTTFLETISDGQGLNTMLDELGNTFVGLVNTVGGETPRWRGFFVELQDAARAFGALANEIFGAVGQGARNLSQVMDLLGRGDFRGAARLIRDRALEGIEDITSGEFTRRVVRHANESEQRAEERRTGGDMQTAVPPRGRGGRGGRRRGGGDDFYNDDGALAREEEFYQETLRLEEQFNHDKRELREAEAEREKEKAQEIHEFKLTLLEEEKEAAHERMEAELENLDRQREAAREAFEETRQQAEEILQPAVDGIIDATVAIITGNKSAEEAFRGMLSGFLQFISQKAGLSAAAEFAEAIASFAGQKYDAGAMHIAAGVAWTAVAIAAGAASAVVAPPAAAAPASPQMQAGEAQGERTVVVNWNAPIVSAGTRAELGREIGAMVREGERRFTAAA